MADQAEMYYWASPVRFAAYAMKTGDLSHLMNVKEHGASLREPCLKTAATWNS
jgi:Ni,Fe-hydrogenase I large subunit